MEFTFNESVHLVDAYMDEMLHNIDTPLRYQLQAALYILVHSQPSDEQIEDSYAEGFREGRSDWNETSYEDGYDNGYDAAYKEMERAQ